MEGNRKEAGQNQHQLLSMSTNNSRPEAINSRNRNKQL